MTEKGYGPHLTACMRGCSLRAISDLNILNDFLTDLPLVIGMEILDNPKIINHKDPDPSESGCTGMVIIKTSHIAFHAYPNRDGYLFLDIFSCKAFDVERAKQYIEQTFKPKTVVYNLITRGLDFPRDN